MVLHYIDQLLFSLRIKLQAILYRFLLYYNRYTSRMLPPWSGTNWPSANKRSDSIVWSITPSPENTEKEKHLPRRDENCTVWNKICHLQFWQLAPFRYFGRSTDCNPFISPRYLICFYLCSLLQNSNSQIVIPGQNQITSAGETQGGPNTVLRVIVEHMLYPITLDILYQVSTRATGHPVHCRLAHLLFLRFILKAVAELPRWMQYRV